MKNVRLTETAHKELDVFRVVHGLPTLTAALERLLSEQKKRDPQFEGIAYSLHNAKDFVNDED